jgi:hypothetical protein
VSHLKSTPRSGSERQGEVVDDPSTHIGDANVTQAQERFATSSDQDQVAALP